MSFKVISAEEAASYIHHDDNVGFGGFTAAGTPKVVPAAIAKKAQEEHDAGRPFAIGVFTELQRMILLMGLYPEPKQ